MKIDARTIDAGGPCLYPTLEPHVPSRLQFAKVRGAHTSNFRDLTSNRRCASAASSLSYTEFAAFDCRCGICLAYRRSDAARLLEHSQNGFLDCHSWMVR